MAGLHFRPDEVSPNLARWRVCEKEQWRSCVMSRKSLEEGKIVDLAAEVRENEQRPQTPGEMPAIDKFGSQGKMRGLFGKLRGIVGGKPK